MDEKLDQYISRLIKEHSELWKTIDQIHRVKDSKTATYYIEKAATLKNIITELQHIRGNI